MTEQDFSQPCDDQNHSRGPGDPAVSAKACSDQPAARGPGLPQPQHSLVIRIAKPGAPEGTTASAQPCDDLTTAQGPGGSTAM